MGGFRTASTSARVYLFFFGVLTIVFFLEAPRDEDQNRQEFLRIPENAREFILAGKAVIPHAATVSDS